MSANLRFSTKSIFLIMALVMIPTSIAFAVNIGGTEGNDILYGGDTNDFIKGQGGNDILLGGGNDDANSIKPERLVGGGGNDELVGDADVLGECANLAPNTVTCGGVPGADKLNGGNADDFVVGDQDNDELIGGQGGGEDVLWGSADNDGLVGGNGDDELHGGFGNDILRGGNGNDYLTGDHGDDDLAGGHGEDFLDGGFGFDICRVDPEDDIWINCEIVIDITKKKKGDIGPDADNDGISTEDELSGALNPFGPNETTDPNNPDSDGDGFLDGQEIFNGSNPNDPNDPEPLQQPTTFNTSALIADVEALASPPSDPELSGKDRKQLITKLESAQDNANAGNLPAACQDMDGFDKNVNTLLDRGKIDPVGGAKLLVDSRSIQDEHCDTPDAQADLELTKTVDNANPPPTSDITFTVTVTNNGPEIATNVEVTDILPAGFAAVPPAVGSFSGSTWTVGTLIIGQSATLDITGLSAILGETVSNTAEVTASDQPDPDSIVNNNVLAEDDQDSDSATSVLVATADLSLTVTVDNSSPTAGDNITFTVTITNNGPDTATNVEVSDKRPGGFKPKDATTTQGSFSGSTWDVGTLTSGQSETLTMTGPAGSAGNTVTNSAEVSASDQVDPDSTPNNNIPAEDDQDSDSATAV